MIVVTALAGCNQLQSYLTDSQAGVEILVTGKSEEPVPELAKEPVTELEKVPAVEPAEEPAEEPAPEIEVQQSLPQRLVIPPDAIIDPV